MKTCHVTRCGDQNLCGPCGLQWDVTDPEPPTCKHRSIGVVAKRVERLAPGPYVKDWQLLAQQMAGRLLTDTELALARVLMDEAYELGRKSRP